MVRKGLLKSLIVCIILIIFAWLVMSVNGDGDRVIMVSPKSGTNNSGSIVFNVNFTNATDITDPRNATFYYNVSGVWTFIANTTPSVGCNSGKNCSVTVNTATLTDGIYSINATLDNGTTQVRIIGYGNLSNEVTIDNTKPIVFNANISAPTAGRNYSGSNIKLNVSVADVTSPVNRVYFNVTNSTGMQNATFTATREGTTSFYSTFLNTTGFADGIYNITIWANDTAGNMNNSALLENVIFDNTRPRVFNANITSPSPGTNSSGSVRLNVSVVDLTSSIDKVYFNVTNSTGTQNSILTGGRQGTTDFFNVTLTTSNFVDGTYNITVWANDTAGNLNSSALTSDVQFDSTPPMVFNANITSPTSSINYSTATIVINASIIDVLRTIDSVYFNITNGAGVQNASIRATREGTTSSYSTTINTSHFPDGRYNITVFANDTVNNLNKSALVNSIVIDLTVPTITLSCTPNPVVVGDVLTCTCIESDATSGVKTKTFTVNPSTVNTGTYSTSCVVTDYSGNSDTAFFSYSVSGTSSSSGGGGGGGGASSTTKWTTYSVTEKDFREGETRELKSEQRLKVEVNNEDHYVGVISVSSNSAIVEVSSTPQRVSMRAGETKKFEVNGDNYYDMSVTLNSILSNRAKITLLSIHESIPVEPSLGPETGGDEAEVVAPQVVPEEQEEGIGLGIWAIIIIILIIVIAIVWWLIKRR